MKQEDIFKKVLKGFHLRCAPERQTLTTQTLGKKLEEERKLRRLRFLKSSGLWTSKHVATSFPIK